ncbi:hypothetical protein ELH44_37050 [Rhizobium ruizarguesonis]|nr:hypothetical protein ELH44_37050 [Rhizobium ruizarguesonis]
MPAIREQGFAADIAGDVGSYEQERGRKRSTQVLPICGADEPQASRTARSSPAMTNYDRWNYMPEKHAGMAKWDKFVRTMLGKKRLKIAA